MTSIACPQAKVAEWGASRVFCHTVLYLHKAYLPTRGRANVVGSKVSHAGLEDWCIDVLPVVLSKGLHKKTTSQFYIHFQ